MLEIELGRLDESIAVYEGIIGNLDPEHEGSVKRARERLHQQGRLEELYATYERALRVARSDSGQAEVVTPDGAPALRELGDGERSVAMWKRCSSWWRDSEALARSRSYTRQTATTAIWATSSSAKRLVADSERTASACSCHSAPSGTNARSRAQCARQLRACARPRYEPHAGAVCDCEHPSQCRSHSGSGRHPASHRRCRRDLARGRQARSRPTWSSAASTSRNSRTRTRSRGYTRAVDVNPHKLRGHRTPWSANTEQGAGRARIGIKERRVTGREPAC